MKKEQMKTIAKKVIAVSAETGGSEKEFIEYEVNQIIDSINTKKMTIEEIQRKVSDAIIKADAGIGSSNIDIISYNIAIKWKQI